MCCVDCPLSVVVVCGRCETCSLLQQCGVIWGLLPILHRIGFFCVVKIVIYGWDASVGLSYFIIACLMKQYFQYGTCITAKQPANYKQRLM